MNETSWDSKLKLRILKDANKLMTSASLISKAISRVKYKVKKTSLPVFTTNWMSWKLKITRERTKLKKFPNKLELLELKLITKKQKLENLIKKFKLLLWRIKVLKEKMKIKNIKLVKTKSSDRDNKALFTRIMELSANGNKNASLKTLELLSLTKKEKLL